MNKPTRRTYLGAMEHVGLLKPVPPGFLWHALDLGCGTGKDSDYLHSIGYVVTSVDKENYYKDVLLSDIRAFEILPEKFSFIVCNNALPFIADREEVKKVISSMVAGLKKDAGLYFTLYGPRHEFNNPSHHHYPISTFTLEEILPFLQTLPVDFVDITYSLGNQKNPKNEIIFQESLRFMLRKK